MTTMAQRLEDETERELSPWEEANQPCENHCLWDEVCREGSYINRGMFDWSKAKVFCYY